MLRLILPVAVAFCLAAGPARADIYAFTDAAGVTHFSNVPIDANYKLLIADPVDPAAQGPISACWRSPSSSIRSSSAWQRLKPSNPPLLRAVIVVESGFNSRAVSPKGAMGLMQLMPKTAKRYGASNPFDPAQNIHAGARYLAELITRYDRDLELVLAAYNAGEDAVERSGRRIPAFKETVRYVPRVLRVYKALMDQREVT